MDAICLIGHPSHFGGADTEALDALKLWSRMGLQVHILPTGPISDGQRELHLEKLGYVYHAVRDWPSLQGLHGIAYCNEKALIDADTIRRQARSFTWVGTMCWTWPKCLQMSSNGSISLHLYQTQHQMDAVHREICQAAPKARGLVIVPYFDADDFPFVDPESRPQDRFTFGRISRPDPAKWHKDQFEIYRRFASRRPKSGLVLGWDTKLREKVGAPPEFVNCLPPNAITRQEFYRRVSVLCLAGDTTENLPRVGMEAMSSGTLLVVDNRGGWKDEVPSKYTGWLCDGTEDFVLRMSECANYSSRVAEGINRSRQIVASTWGFEQAAVSWRKAFDILESI